VDDDAFLTALHNSFDRFPDDESPHDTLFRRILDEVGGLAQPNNLALIAAATSALGEGESYVEAGSYKGASLIAAAHGKTGDFVGIDDFSHEDGSRDVLEANLAAFDCKHVTVLEGDVFELLRDGALDGRRIGVYYYDAAHGREQQLEALRLIEPHLVGGALMIVDDTDWEHVAAAVDEYLGSQPDAKELVRVVGEPGGAPAWWEGMRVLRWRYAAAA